MKCEAALVNPKSSRQISYKWQFLLPPSTLSISTTIWSAINGKVIVHIKHWEKNIQLSNDDLKNTLKSDFAFVPAPSPRKMSLLFIHKSKMESFKTEYHAWLYDNSLILKFLYQTTFLYTQGTKSIKLILFFTYLLYLIMTNYLWQFLGIHPPSSNYEIKQNYIIFQPSTRMVRNSLTGLDFNYVKPSLDLIQL